MENNKFDRIRISLIFMLLLIGFFIYVIRLSVAPTEITIGVFNTISIWITISLIPFLIPLLSEKKIMKILTLIIGGLVMLVDIVLPLTIIVDNQMKEPIIWGIFMLIICGFSGLTGIIMTVKWIKN